MRLIFGLGNPGKKYEDTRHNIGFMVVDRLVKNINSKMEDNLKFTNKTKLFCDLAQTTSNNQKFVIVKPKTYMNESGKSVRAVIGFFKACPTDLVVVHDDADLPFGKIKIKHSGSSAGQKGIQSIINALGTDKFTRVRIGIGRPENQLIPLEDWVLGKFTQNKEEINAIINEAVNIIIKKDGE